MMCVRTEVRSRSIARRSRRCTISSASRFIVHRADPLGGGEHATATRRASSSTPSLRGAPGRDSSVSAGAKPSSTNRCLGPVHGRRADTHGARHQVVGGVSIGGEENVRPLHRAHRPLTAAQERLQLVAFFRGQRDAMAYVHGHVGSHSRSHVQPFVIAIHCEAGAVPGLHPHVHAAAPRASSRSGFPTVLSGHAAGGPRHDRRARAAWAHNSSATPTSNHQAARVGRRTTHAATDQNHCGGVLGVLVRLSAQVSSG